MAIHAITFLPANLVIEVDTDLYPYGTHGRPGSLLDIALSHGVQLPHSCGGTGACGTCHVSIESDMAAVTEADDDEMDVVDRIPGNTLGTRLACEAVVQGDVTVRLTS